MGENCHQAARRIAKSVIERGFLPNALHAYTSSDGTPLYFRIRCKHPETGEKWIRPMHLDGDHYKIGEPSFEGQKPVYGLHNLAERRSGIELGEPAATVWIVEGEQKADALMRLGILATTSGGATSALSADWAPLANRKCVIWPDNDEAGRLYAESVTNILVELQCAISIVDSAQIGVCASGDVIDWLAANPNATASDIDKLPRLLNHNVDKTVAESVANEVSLIRASELAPEAIKWLWTGWIAEGKMHILGGAPGTGKTTISMSLAATISTGGSWPDDTESCVGNVVIWSGEDDPADTLIPRLIMAGADLSKIYFISGVTDEVGHRAFDPSSDLDSLRRKLASIGGVRLLIVDPIVSAVAGDSHKNAEVRRSLQPLADLASSMSCALIGLTHFSKGTGGRDPVERLTGSLAFGALARIVLVAAKYQEDDKDGRKTRLLCRAKSNIGKDDGGFEYHIQHANLDAYPDVEASCVVWGGVVAGEARELLSTADSYEIDGSSIAEAKQFLRNTLKDGSVPTKSIMNDAEGAGLSIATIKRAKKMLDVEAIKEGGRFGDCKQQWVWKLPTSVDPLGNF